MYDTRIYMGFSLRYLSKGIHPSILGKDFGFEKLVYVCTNMKCTSKRKHRKNNGQMKESGQKTSHSNLSQQLSQRTITSKTKQR